MLQARQALTDKNFVDKLIKIAGHIAGDPDTARDISQEAFLELLETNEGYDTKKDLIAAFCKIARKHARRLERLFAPLTTLDRVSENQNAIEPASTLYIADIEKALVSLPLKLREIINLRRDDKTQNQIAVFLHIDQSTVSRHLNTARRQVYAAL